MRITFSQTNSLSKRIFFIVLAAMLASCAGSYKPIIPERLTYGSSSESNGIKYAYQHNVLATSGNKKYAKKELKRPVKLMAIEITNSTDRVINFRRDVKMFMGDRLVLPVEPSLIHQQLKQPAPLFLLWGLLWVNITKCDGSNGEDCSSIPLPVGLIIGIGNASVAGSSNAKFLAELSANNILDRQISPGETVRGLVGITSEAAGSISLQLN